MRGPSAGVPRRWDGECSGESVRATSAAGLGHPVVASGNEPPAARTGPARTERLLRVRAKRALAGSSPCFASGSCRRNTIMVRAAFAARSRPREARAKAGRDGDGPLPYEHPRLRGRGRGDRCARPARRRRTLAVGFRCAVDATEEIVHEYCRQSAVLSLYPDVRPSVSHEMDIAWTFDTLLGAMYLQMYWIMASSDSKSRCEHCGRIISLGRPHPDGRKRRRDKKFCDDACRQAHHRSKQVS